MKCQMKDTLLHNSDRLILPDDLSKRWRSIEPALAQCLVLEGYTLGCGVPAYISLGASDEQWHLIHEAVLAQLAWLASYCILAFTVEHL